MELNSTLWGKKETYNNASKGEQSGPATPWDMDAMIKEANRKLMKNGNHLNFIFCP